MDFQELVSSLFLIIGMTVFITDSVGFWRFTNVLTRMHAATKGSTIGLGSILVGTIIYFGDLTITLKLLTLILIFFLTASVGAQAMARAAYRQSETVRGTLHIDDLERHRASDKPIKAKHEPPVTY